MSLLKLSAGLSPTICVNNLITGMNISPRYVTCCNTSEAGPNEHLNSEGTWLNGLGQKN
jgi:hypothetical protein